MLREPKHCLTTLLVVGLFALLMLSCSSDKGTDSPSNVQVSGQVLAYVCGGNLGVPEDDHYWDTLPYSTKTGLPAEIEFTSDAGAVTNLETDDLSEFELSLPTGLYTIRIETDHTRPDYFDSVALTADTMMNLLIRYDYASTDYIYLAFCYEGTGYGPLTPEAERAFLDQLNDTVGGMLLLDDAWRVPANCVIYQVPINRDYRMWEVVKAVAYQLMVARPHPALNMFVPSYGFCPEDFIIMDTTFNLPFDSLYDPPEDSLGIF